MSTGPRRSSRRSWRMGLEVHRGLAETGVVGVLRNGTSSRKIGLRADMDALHIHEKNAFAHKSTNEGKMHACGHDGHTTMLLGAARHLAQKRNFDGTVHFIFQPAEENEGGARAMIEEGLFDRFPCDTVWGMHNWPELPLGQFCVMPGPMMARFDLFEITRDGPRRACRDAAQRTRSDRRRLGTVQALQTIVSRNTHPVDAGVVSVTQFHGGDTWNVIPNEVVLARHGACVQDRRAGRDRAAHRAKSAKASQPPTIARSSAGTTGAIRRRSTALPRRRSRARCWSTGRQRQREDRT